MESIFEKCHGARYIFELSEMVWRIVHDDAAITTRKLVDTNKEHRILEDIIASQKPILLHAYSHYHPLLSTPFRYPSGLSGSRFANSTAAPLWYGSLQLETAMKEKAFYQFNFLNASSADFGIVETSLTAFSVAVKTARGIQLTKVPFNDFRKDISNPISYAASQALGASMRHLDVRAFTYYSARDLADDINLALFTPRAFHFRHPVDASFQAWRLISNKTMIEFHHVSAMHRDLKSFSLQSFLINGNLPNLFAQNQF